MNGYRSPCAKLTGRHLEISTDGRKYEECYGIENKHHSERHGHLMVIGLEHRAYSSYGTAAAYGCARRNEVGRLAVELKPVTEQHTHNHHAKHRHDGKHHAVAAAFERLGEIHAETESDHRSLEQIFGSLLVEFRIRTLKNQCIDYAQKQCEPRGDSHSCTEQVKRCHNQ